MKLQLTALSRFAAVALAFTLVAGLALATTSSGYADNDDNRKKSSSDKELERSQFEDREFSGQVLEINTLKRPPELKVAGIDGQPMTVVVIKEDEVVRAGVRLGDHISGFGEKIHEYLFEAQLIKVDSHLGENDNK